MARANAFWPTAVVGEADSVNSVSASACHIGGPKGVSPGKNAWYLQVRLSFIYQSQIDEWIAKTDWDGDGKITLEEFKLGMAGSALIDDDLAS